MTTEQYVFIGIASILMTWGIASFIRTLQGSGKQLMMVLLSIGMFSSFYYFNYTNISNYDPNYNVDNDIDKVFQALEKYLINNPEDMNAKKVFAEYNLQIGNYNEAYQYYEEIYTSNIPKDIEVIVGLIESTLLSRPDIISYDLNDLINQSLKIEPLNQKALWFGGLIARASGNFELAKERWSLLIEDPELPIDMQQAVNEQLVLINSIKE
ncbi:MAG TPA: hypothetical protein EYQ72_01030 [Gammaproteobacteria bacterium]|jgi:cytochrome c-type biogenesis protein CcmH/NrfG|nr:hypothetical protein [Gammaproteobacteria bacterium]HIK77669.1 hypothetical protein [Gammaproteobacteria bacterium]